MIKLLQIVPVSGFRLFGQMVKKEIDLSKRGVGTFYRSAGKERDRAKWSHSKYKGWIRLHRSEGEVVTAEIRSLSKSGDGWQLLCAETKAKGINEIVVGYPWVLGDNYEELIESLSRLADAGLSVAISARKHWPSLN